MARELMCMNHPDRPTETRCRQCQKPICKECVKSDADGQFCSFQCSEDFKDFAARQRAGADKKGGLVKKLVLLVIVVVVLLFVGKACGLGFCAKILKLVGVG